MTDLDNDVLELLDFEFAPPCEAPIGCESEAEWKVTVACCGHVYLLCQECLDAHLDCTRYANETNQHIQCVLCNKSRPGNNFLHSIERI